MERPEILMAPGPTPIPPEVLLAQGSPLVYHRGPSYGALLREVTEGLQEMLKTSSDVLLGPANWRPLRTTDGSTAVRFVPLLRR